MKKKKPGKIHAAGINSCRLQRVLSVISDRQEHSTREIIRRAHVCAVNSIIAEMRARGYDIACRRIADVWLYRMAGQAA